MPGRSELRGYLLARGAEQEELFKLARAARLERFGDEVVLRGVVEITNTCRVNCDYCPMRRDNASHNERFSLSSEEIVRSARAVRQLGINVVMLQGGETTSILLAVEEAIPAIVDLFDGQVEILLNLGCFRRERYVRLRELGATSYILKHETSDAELHHRLRHESLRYRLSCLRELIGLGYRVGTGIISGLPGQSIDSILDDLELAGELGVDMCSVSPFIPASDTPLGSVSPGDVDLALNIIACLRLAYPTILIPSVSALERAGVAGQSRGLQAGANVLTVNFSPAERRDSYLIYGRSRFVVTVDHVHEIVRSAGLRTRGSLYVTLPLEAARGTSSAKEPQYPVEKL
ncbi:radical SAM protein [Burkholderia sp. Bp9142]|uniref:radical SAM protein n=1 Tax=Burkholderia sp. Bp9142 TaxID=2184573 RepID=UPI000F597EE1|nr:radical SAM protein [Burkholderia sp. Bp9142]RQR40633.1 radical SAM protein [Burkholderia sp. Bp9142]